MARPDVGVRDWKFRFLIRKCLFSKINLMVHLGGLKAKHREGWLRAAEMVKDLKEKRAIRWSQTFSPRNRQLHMKHQGS